MSRCRTGVPAGNPALCTTPALATRDYPVLCTPPLATRDYPVLCTPSSWQPGITLPYLLLLVQEEATLPYCSCWSRKRQLCPVYCSCSWWWYRARVVLPLYTTWVLHPGYTSAPACPSRPHRGPAAGCTGSRANPTILRTTSYWCTTYREITRFTVGRFLVREKANPGPVIQLLSSRARRSR